MDISFYWNIQKIRQTCWKCEHEWTDEYKMDWDDKEPMVCFECPACEVHWYDYYDADIHGE